MHSVKCCLFRCSLVCFVRTDEHWSTRRGRLRRSLVAMLSPRHQPTVTYFQSWVGTCNSVEHIRIAQQRELSENCFRQCTLYMHRMTDGRIRLIFILCHPVRIETCERGANSSQCSRRHNGNSFSLLFLFQW